MSLLCPLLARADQEAADWSRPFTTAESVTEGYSAKIRQIGPHDPRALFMRIYEQISQEVVAMLDRHEFKNEAWVRGLMVAYANMYREAFHEQEAGLPRTSPAWTAAFAENLRSPPREASYQLLISINAHVNRDLPHALVAAGTDFSRKDLFEDFKRISRSFVKRMPELWHILHEFDHCPRPWAEREAVLLLMFKVMSGRRALAWKNGQALYKLRQDQPSLEQETERLEHFSMEQIQAINRSILTRTEHRLCGPNPRQGARF